LSLCGLEFSPAKLVLRRLLGMLMAPMVIMLRVVLIVLMTDMLMLPIDLSVNRGWSLIRLLTQSASKTDQGPRDVSR
jgi:hypothetical protein